MVKRVKRWYKRCKGFTLMEVLVTVLIIGVLAAISYPVYKKSVTKARAAEAVNLIQLVKNKQILTYANEGKYFSDFGKVGRITQGAEEAQGAQLKVNRDYTVYLNNAQTCVTAYYKKDTPAEFSFSSGYENDGLGCSGGVCNSYGNILGDTKSVCNCGTKTCGNGYTLNQDTCSCECLLGCENSGSCYAPYGGGQSRPCASGCGTEHSSSTCGGPSWSGSCSSPTQTQATRQACPEGCGTMYRSCSATCGGGECGSWDKSACKAPSQNQATSQSCGNGGTQTRTCSATCGGGSCGSWSSCTGQSCNSSSKPSSSESCGNCGTRTRSVYCDSDTGSWDYDSWGSCSGEGECSVGATQSCGGGNGTQTCSGSCGWGECTCNSGYHMEGGTCVADKKECPASSKPANSQSCGGSGTQTRTVTCDENTGNWKEGDWSECSCDSSTCWNGSTCQTKPTSTYCNCGPKGRCTTSYTCQNGSGWIANESTCICQSGAYTAYINGKKYCYECNPNDSSEVVCGTADCGRKKCQSSGTYTSCYGSRREGSTGAYHDTYCPMGWSGHSVYCGAGWWDNNSNCCIYGSRGCFSGGNIGRQDYSENGPLTYIP